MMQFGTALIGIAFGAVLISIALYLASLRDKGKGSPSLVSLAARIAFFVAVACIVGASAVHATLLMTHRFDDNYVYHYSARELTSFYLFSTFWAGQEGSFLLWAFWTSVLGVFLALKSGAFMERRVMPIYGGVLGFLLLLLIVKSPFVPYAQATPMDPAHPANGMGMNPLLENPWMVVHPPTLFLGFASLAATFAFALSASLWPDYDLWFRRTWPWALFSFAVLGFGVMLGGYWAYETLGWGGFWGWDPVENGPLVPWLGMAAFVHSAQVQRVRGGLKKTTLFLGMFPFVAALYETFLTRTGILDKFSNHSFSTLGGVANSIILYGLVGAIAVSLFLLAWRSRAIKSEANAWDNASSRDFGMTLAIVILLACAVITGVGMSAPLITQAGVDLHLVARQSSIDPTFYNKANFPVAILIGLGMAIGPYLAWKATRAADITPLNGAYVVSVLGALIFYAASSFLGHFKVAAPMILLFMACIFAVVANGQILLLRYTPLLRSGGGAEGGGRPALRTAGAYMAHIGAALLLLGVVCLVTFTRKDDPILIQGHSMPLADLPYNITYAGMTSPAGIDDRTNEIKLDVQSTDGKHAFTALMPCAVRDVEGNMQLLARPAIVNKWWGDLYFALKEGPDPVYFPAPQNFTLAKGQVTEIDGYKIAFVGYWVPPDIAALLQQGKMPAAVPVRAILLVTTPDGKSYPMGPQFIQRRNDPLEPQSPELLLPRIPGSVPAQQVTLAPLDHPGRMAIAFDKMDADHGTASFYVRNATYKPVTAFVIEVSTRPGIGLVWLGTILIALGGLFSMRRRALENRLAPVPDPSTGEREAGVRRRLRAAPAPKPAPVAMEREAQELPSLLKGGH